MFDVSILVVTFNSGEVVGECLAPFAEESRLEIVVVDNGSSDGTLEVVAEVAPRARVLEMPENLGFARAVNAGAEVASGENILLLNPDARLSADSVLGLADRVARREGLCVVAPLILDAGQTRRVLEFGRFPALRTVAIHFLGLSGSLARLSGGMGLYGRRMPSDMTECDWVSGACLMVPSGVWSELGGLTERWFMYAEDWEFCWRVRQAGLSVAVLPEFTASHAMGTGSSRRPPEIASAWIVNLYDFYSWRMEKSPFKRSLWRGVVSYGLITRAAIFRVLAIGRPSAKKVVLRRQAAEFGRAARDLWGASSRD